MSGREKSAWRGFFSPLPLNYNKKNNGKEQADERVTVKKHQPRWAFTHVFIAWLNTGTSNNRILLRDDGLHGIMIKTKYFYIP